MIDAEVILKHVGARMGLARRIANIRPGEMAARLRVHRNQIGAYERGEVVPSFRVFQWAVITGQSPAFFFEGLPLNGPAPIPIEAFMDPAMVDVVMAASRLSVAGRERLAAFLRTAAGEEVVEGPPTGVNNPPTVPARRPAPIREEAGVREPTPEV